MCNNFVQVQRPKQGFMSTNKSTFILQLLQLWKENNNGINPFNQAV